MINFFSKLKKSEKGFTLVELMVSVTLFTSIMVISMGSILSVIDANRKAKNLRSVMDNLSYTLESMTRTMRFGSSYHCNVGYGSPDQPNDYCPGGSDSIAVKSNTGVLYTYRLSGGRIVRTVGCIPLAVGCVDQYLTGSDVNITSLNFKVYGSAPYGSNGTDLYQPLIIAVISGQVGARNASTFTIQTAVTQRFFDSQ